VRGKSFSYSIAKGRNKTAYKIIIFRRYKKNLAELILAVQEKNQNWRIFSGTAKSAKISSLKVLRYS